MEQPSKPQTGETEQQIIDRLFKERDAYEAATRSKRVEMENIWKAFNGENPQKEPWKSDYYIPKIRTELSYIAPYIFSGDPELELEGVGKEDKVMAEIFEEIENYRLTNLIKAHTKVKAWILQGCLLGTSFIKTCWKFEVKNGKPVKDESDLEVPHVLDIFANPLIPTIEWQTSLIQRSILTLEQIKQNPAYKNTDKIQPKGNNQASGIYTSNQFDQTDIDSPESLANKMASVEVYTRYTADRVQVVADAQERILLQDEENKYGFIPFDVFRYEDDPIPNRLYGRGIGQNTIGLSKSYYDVFNNMVDNIKILINKMYRVSPGVNLNPRDLVSRPGGFVKANREDIEPFEQADITSSTFELLTLLSDEHKRASGANDLIQSSASGDTLGQDELRQQNSTMRFELVKKGFRNAFASVGWKLIQLEVKYLQDPNAPILRIFPEKLRETIFLLITQNGSEVVFNVKLKGGTAQAQNKDIASKQMMEMFANVAPLLMPNEQRTWIRTWLKLKDIPQIVGEDLDSLVGEAPQMETPMEQQGEMGQEEPMMPQYQPSQYETPQGAAQSVRAPMYG